MHRRQQSQVVLLSASAGILVEMPLDITILILKGSAPDLEDPHRHARTNLTELAAVVACADVNMLGDVLIASPGYFSSLHGPNLRGELQWHRRCF